jgi:hypothetical protein
MSDPSRAPNGKPANGAHQNGANGAGSVPDDFIQRYLEEASEDELRALDALAELDRKYGNRPTPR